MADEMDTKYKDEEEKKDGADAVDAEDVRL
jgi:hypothetical protein